ncbi:hypothetical protein PQO03_07565 [Lentisphaera profundi]|uniref:YceK/YidQ family lipoprotein n=1 Tax=Lentisphaera profundi TaxID=1658616 RepID=A0ABY7VRU2_9BACT|nr:hypothetical protein [Lentisphaera profundi]WDE95576.1 hypothetical protein PQO03_07565 [Lentisphaera profundi]
MKNFIITTITLFLSGCTSIVVHEGFMEADGHDGDVRTEMVTPLYAGTTSDLSGIINMPKEMIEEGEAVYVPLFIIVAIIDTPLSFIADTLYLPSDIAYWKTWSKYQDSETEENRTEENRTEENRTEENRTEENRTEENRTEENRTEENRTEENRNLNQKPKSQKANHELQ